MKNPRWIGVKCKKSVNKIQKIGSLNDGIVV